MNKPKPTLLVLLILVPFLGSCSAGESLPPSPQPTVSPSPSPLTIDGTILPGEWSQAASYDFPGGSKLYLLAEGSRLYLAVDGSRPGVMAANVYLNRGNLVQILHISAALGTAEYSKEGENWSLTRNFDWQHRTVGNGPAALAERQAYHDQEGWSAPNGLTGAANHLELQIEIEPDTRMAISLLQSGASTAFVWPAGLEDDTSKSFPDGLEAVLSLQPESWFPLP